MHDWAMRLKNAERAKILASLDAVGATKAIGYLPVKTVQHVLGLTLSDLRDKCEAAGLTVIIYSESDSCIGSGAFFVYHPGMVESTAGRYAGVLSMGGWSREARHVVDRVASRWLEPDDPLISFVRALFGESEEDPPK